MGKVHLALYGQVSIPRRYCSRCKCFTLIVDGTRQCCGYSIKEDLKTARTKRMCLVQAKRKKPSPAEKEKILERQDNRCLYCQQRFGNYYHRNGKLLLVYVEYDHLEPYAFGYNNDVRNFVATCRLCNRWKSSKMFKTVEAIREFLLKRWEVEIWSKSGKDPELAARLAIVALKDCVAISDFVVLPADGKNGNANIQGSN